MQGSCHRCGKPTEMWVEAEEGKLWLCSECALKGEGKTNKFNAQSVTIDGIFFASTLEGDRYHQLKLMQAAGLISNLKTQPRYQLLPKKGRERAWWHRPDFEYLEDGKLVVEDTKGVPTELWKLKRRLFTDKYPEILYRVLTKEDVYA